MVSPTRQSVGIAETITDAACWSFQFQTTFVVKYLKRSDCYSVALIEASQ